LTPSAPAVDRPGRVGPARRPAQCRAGAAAQQLPAAAAWAALDTLRRLALTRYPGFPLTERVWELRENLSAYDATYVALAEALDCSLLTADGRLSRAPGIRCAVTVIPG
jgi:predicted nucleic acid-binding protein